jgi:pimeloyl-ACP methyl ester carboxylesterase
MREVSQYTVEYERSLLKGDSCFAQSSLNVLCLHGAGQSNRLRFAGLRSALQHRGFGSASFDFIGHGETGGVVENSSLASRTAQANAVIRSRGLYQRPLTVVGSSMGAYAAIKLTQLQNINSLVLVVPGVYTPNAYSVPFGTEFSSIIRQHQSWRDTDAWMHMAEFRGSLLVVAAENDQVVPFEIPQRLMTCASACSWKKLHVVKDAGHNVMSSLFDDGSASTEGIIEDIVACIHAGVG